MENKETYNMTKSIKDLIKHCVDDGFTTKEAGRKFINHLEMLEFEAKDNRMAPIYSNQDSFEAALDKAWKYYNDSAEAVVDGCEDNSMELAFAKGFREGVLYKEQKSAEWSEEDEFFRQQLIVYCENCVQDTLAAKCVDWLKSLRPQPHWKPSKEQMRAVFDASERNDKLGSVLSTLYNDLKKL